MYTVDFDSDENFYGGLLVSLVVDEEIPKKYVSYVSILHAATDDRSTKAFKGWFGPASNQLTIEVPIDKGVSNDEKAIVKVITDNADDLKMHKLAKTLKGIFKALTKFKKATRKIVLTFDEEIEFSNEHFNTKVPEGQLKKILLPVEHSHKVKNKVSNIEKTYNHHEALIIWRAFMVGTDVPLDDSDAESSDDEMQQLAGRTSGMTVT